MSVSTMNTGFYEPLIYLISSALFAACVAYLVRRYLEKREKITWLFIAFFAVTSVFFFVDFLIVTDILQFTLNPVMILTFLIAATIVAIIGVVMLGVRELYTFPAFVATIAFFNQTALDSNRTLMMNSIQLLSYSFTGQFIGNPWYITLKNIFPNLVPIGGQASITIPNLFFDPLAVILPSRFVVALYLAAIVIPTAVLFYILAWKNRSGRSLGFALGLTVNIIFGFTFAAAGNLRSLLGTVLILIASILYALGIIGAFDKLMKKKESQKNMKKEKT